MGLFADVALSMGAEFCLPMNEATGQFVDVTGNGYNADVFGALTRNSSYSNVNGVTGCLCDAKGAGYAIMQKASPWVNNNDWTLGIWFAQTNAMNTTTRGYVNAWEPWLVQPNDERIKNTVWNCTFAMLAARTNSYPWFYIGSGRARHSNLSASNASYRDDTNYAFGDNFTAEAVAIDPVTSQNMGQYGRTFIWMRGLLQPWNGAYGDVGLNSTVFATKYSQLDSQVHHQNYPSKTIGMGLFGIPTSLSTVLNAASQGAQKVWLAHAVGFKRALLDSEITTLYQAGVGTAPSGNRVSGSTLLDGVALGGFPVYVHRRDTGALIAKTKSDVNGSFTCYVGSYAGQVYAVAFDTVSGRTLPAQVFDLITPSL